MDIELYRAAMRGNISVIGEKERTLVVEDQLTPDKNSVLHVASQSGKREFVEQILLMHPSLLHNTNSRGETALFLAAREGHSHVVKALIDEEKRRPSKDLENGVISSSVKMMLTTADGQGNTALHEAVRYNHLNVVKVLLNEDPGENSLHTPNKDDETPLYMAAYRGQLDLVKAICEICTSPPPYGGPDGKTALHAAIINHEKECVKYLLSWKTTMIKEADVHGCTAFHYAASDLSSAEILKDLLKVDKSVAYQAEKFGNKTPLHVAAIQDNFPALKELIESCPDSCCMIDKSDRNVLHFVAEFCLRTRTIEFMLQQYPAIFGRSLLIQKDSAGNTPLHLLNKRDSDARKIMRKYTEDKEEFNRNHQHTPVNKDGGNTIKQLLSEERRNDDCSDRTQRFLKAIRDEKLKIKVDDHIKLNENEEIERLRKTADTHMIVAALVTTVSFAAGFTLPGGYDGNEGPNQGLAILVRKHAFKAFMVTDTITLLFSIASLLMYFLAADLDEIEELTRIYTHAANLNSIAIGAMMLTFVTGTYVVLAHSLGLAITVCLIGCSFFIFLFVKLKKVLKRVWFRFCDFLLRHTGQSCQLMAYWSNNDVSLPYFK